MIEAHEGDKCETLFNDCICDKSFGECMCDLIEVIWFVISGGRGSKAEIVQLYLCPHRLLLEIDTPWPECKPQVIVLPG